MKQARFIVIDGCEGAGKSTLIQSAVKKIGNTNILITREPGGSPFAEDVRSLMLKHPLSSTLSPETQFGLAWAARHNHLVTTIVPALQRGIAVISDRFDSSTYAYQVGDQSCGHSLEKAFWEVREAFLAKCKPDLYIFLDVEPRIGLARVASRKGEVNHFDGRALEYHERIRAGLKKFFEHVPHIVIDANRSQIEVEEDFLKTLDRFLSSKGGITHLSVGKPAHS